MTEPDPLQPSARDEQLSMVLLHTRVATVAATGFAVLMAVYVHGIVASPLVTGWVVVKLAVALVRIALAQAHARSAGRGPHWRRVTHAMLAVDGLVWGVAGFTLMAQAEPLAALAAASLAGVSCVATFGLQLSLAATAAYVVPILAPTAAGLIARGDDFGWIGGLGLLVLLGLQLVTARAAQRRFLATLALGRRAAALADEKDAALRLATRQAAAKTQFLANISHELRTPLHGILGLARLLHLELRQPGQLRHVELIESSGTHLLRLINDLLDVSRLETSRFSLRQEAFDLRAQVQAVADVYAVRAADKGLGFSLTQRLPPQAWVTGDAARLRQVLHNLLGNAIKFTQHGEIGLTVSHDGAPDRLCFEVRDSGGGIPEAQLGQIFQPFNQGALQGDQVSRGAGLGLTIAREIAQAMGGDIQVRSTTGLGSSFVFSARLPAADQPAPQAGRGAGPAPQAPLPLRVLVADDDDVNALIVAHCLDQLGIAHERVANGRDAVGRALRETERPELILMDCRMPVMDGLAATREIRAQEATLGLPWRPIVAMTATGADHERAQCLAAGMDQFLSKPFTQAELVRAMALATAGLPKPD